MSAPRNGVGAAGKPSRGKPSGLIAVVAMVFIRGAGPAWPSGIAAGASRTGRCTTPGAASPLYPPRTCATCGQEFTPVRVDQRYCCRWCREHRYLTRVASGLPPDNLSLGRRT
jgi:hypothetical protein